MDITTLVEDATSELLLVPQWQANLDISDLLAGGRREILAAFASALRKKLMSPNPKVVALSITLLDSVAKNGGPDVWTTIARQEIAVPLREVAEGRTGPETQISACGLLQDLAAGLPASQAHLPFRAICDALRARGAPFPPPPPNAALLFTAAPPPPPAPLAHAQSSSGRAGGPARDPLTGAAFAPSPVAAAAAAAAPPRPSSAEVMAAAFAKLWSDLRAVRVCVAAAARTLLGGSSRAEPAFLDAVDLLAQSQPRLVQLIEAGATGDAALEEALFEELLAVNDAVARVLDASRAAAPQLAPALLAELTDFGAQQQAPRAPAPAVAAAPLSLLPASPPTLPPPRQALLQPQAEQQQPQRPAAATAVARGSDDLLGLFMAPPAAAPAPAPVAAAAAAAPPTPVAVAPPQLPQFAPPPAYAAGASAAVLQSHEEQRVSFAATPSTSHAPAAQHPTPSSPALVATAPTFPAAAAASGGMATPFDEPPVGPPPAAAPVLASVHSASEPFNPFGGASGGAAVAVTGSSAPGDLPPFDPFAGAVPAAPSAPTGLDTLLGQSAAAGPEANVSI